MPCEDYPCCGHEPGDCPDKDGRMKCVICWKKLSKKATSSICNRCLKQMRDHDYEDPNFGPDRYDFGY